MEMLRYPIIALVIGWILGAVFTKLLLPYLEKKQFKQFVREVGPQSHLSKTGTPSMAGLRSSARLCWHRQASALPAGVADGWHLVVILLVMYCSAASALSMITKRRSKRNNAASARSKRSSCSSYSPGLSRSMLICIPASERYPAAQCGSRLWTAISTSDCCTSRSSSSS